VSAGGKPISNLVVFGRPIAACWMDVCNHPFLRFNETKKPEKSEYVLAGTLLSLTIALVCGWIVFMS